MNRILECDYVKKLEEILDKYPHKDILFWKEFYDFIIISYKKEPHKRFGVSQLGEYLKKRKTDKIELILMVYFNGMYILARKDGKEIYGEDFNI